MNEEAKEKISCSNYDQCESCFLGHECERVVVVEQLIKDSNSQLLERLSEKLDNGFEEYMVKKSDVKALIQSKKSL